MGGGSLTRVVITAGAAANLLVPGLGCNGGTGQVYVDLQTRTHLAIVMDEYRSVAGVVAIEDVGLAVEGILDQEGEERPQAVGLGKLRARQQT